MTTDAGRSRLRPPPRETAARLLRRRWRSRKRLGRFQYWLAFVGLPMLVIFLGLYIANGFTNGWPKTYDIAVTITSPSEANIAWLAWPLSAIGWALTPALTGAIIGYIVTNSIESRRSRRRDEVLIDEMRPTPGAKPEPSAERVLIPRLADLVFDHPVYVLKEFVDPYVLSHDGDWNTSQDHWELVVGKFLDSDAVPLEADESTAMAAAVVAAAAALSGPPFKGQCPICPQQTLRGTREIARGEGQHG